MTTPCCSSNWWHCPLYLAMSITLAVIAISTATHLSKSDSSLSLYTNATLALRTHGFNSTATLLQLSPDLFLSSQQFTFFAIKDGAFLDTNPQFLKELLQYHSLPVQIDFSDLKKTPQGFCYQTLAQGKRIAITKNNLGKIEINNVSVSHPDLFLADPVSIHGVTGPFSTFGPGEITEPPSCQSTEIKKLSQWSEVFQFLSSSGYVPFGIGLNSALEKIIQEYPNLVSATVFAPVDFAYVSSSRGFLDRVVRYHIVPRRLAYSDLSSLPDKSFLKTLIPENDLVISDTKSTKELKLEVNRVGIIAPNAFLSQNFVIHGIAKGLALEDLPNTSL